MNRRAADRDDPGSPVRCGRTDVLLPVVPLIDVQHPDTALHGREAVLFREQKRFRKAKHGLVRLFGVSIVEDHIIGKRERNLPDSVQVQKIS